LESGGKVTYELIEGWWKDTGSLQDLLEANQLALDEIENELHTPYDYTTVYTGKLHIGKNVTIRNSVIMGPAVIADNSVITNSYIGPYTTISTGVNINNCEISNCIILENTQIEEIDMRISNSLIGKDVIIKNYEKKPYSALFLVGDNSKIYL
jgi:glucose-1-phosphate thymidylyltransferase